MDFKNSAWAKFLVGTPTLALVVSMLWALPASAAETSELTSRWNAPVPTQIPNGEVVTGEVRLNVNDPATGEAGVRENATAVLTLANGRFAKVPTVCTQGTPAGSLNADGNELTCNVGDLNFATAQVIAFDAIAEGPVGSNLSGTVTFAGQTSTLPPIEIVENRGIDVVMNSTSSQPGGNYAPVQTLLPFGVSIPRGGTELQDEIVFTFNLSQQTGPDPSIMNVELPTCRNITATGVNSIPATTAQAPVPGTCTVTQPQNNVPRFVVRMSDFKTPQNANAPTVAKSGDPLPSNRRFFATGEIVLSSPVAPVSIENSSFIFDATVNSVQAETVNGQAITEELSTTNNTQRATYLGPGQRRTTWSRGERNPLFSPAGNPNALDRQGNVWDAAVFAGNGDTVVAETVSRDYAGATAGSRPAGETAIVCIAARPGVNGVFNGRFSPDLGQAQDWTYEVSTQVPTWNDFQCDDTDGNWTEPAYTQVGTRSGNLPVYDVTNNPEAVRAMRISIDVNALPAGVNHDSLGFAAGYTVQATTPDDAFWVVGAHRRGRPSATVWNNDSGRPDIAATPNRLYSGTNIMRDVVRTAAALPIVDKRVNNVSPAPEETLTYTLESEATAEQPNGVGPTTYEVKDVLPAGLTYEPGSASRTPTSVRTLANNSTEITWTYTDAEANTPNTLTYRATVNAVRGTLTNTATATLPAVPDFTPSARNEALSTATVALAPSGQTVLVKDTSTPSLTRRESGTWRLTLQNNTAEVQNVTDVIDVLPFNGDGRGTDFAGDYTIDNVNASRGEDIYYTTVAPATLDADPEAGSNGGFGTPSARWTTTKPANAAAITGVRFVGANLPIGETTRYTINWTPRNAQVGDIYDNYSVARTTTTELRMIRAARSTIAAAPTVLQVDKTTAQTVAAPGERIVYDITASNVSNNAVDDVTVEDVIGNGLDASTVQIEGGPSQGAFDPVTGLWTVGTLGANSNATLRISVEVDADYRGNDPIVNSVAIEAPTVPRLDPTCDANDSVTDDTDQCDTVEVDAYQADVQIDKTETAVNFAPGATEGTVTWLLTVRGNGPQTSTNVVVQDDLPAGATNVTATTGPSQGTFDPATGTWTVGTLAPNATATLAITATFERETVLAGVTNIAVVNSTEDPYAGGTDENVTVTDDTDNYDEVTSSLTPEADVRIDKSGGEVTGLTSAPDSTGRVTWTVEVANAGPDAATNVAVEDNLPAGFVPNSGRIDEAPSQGTATINNGSLTWTVGSLANNANATITFSAVYDRSSLEDGIVNAATVTATEDTIVGGNEPNDSVEEDTDNYDEVVTEVPPAEAEVRIVKRTVGQVNIGDETDNEGTVTWEIVVQNDGPDAATAVEVEDTLPASTVADSFTVIGNETVTQNAGGFVWNVGTLASGAQATLTFETAHSRNALENGVVNEATVSADQDPYSGGTEPNATVEQDEDNFDNASVNIPTLEANVKVEKRSVGAIQIAPGDAVGTVTWQVNFANDGLRTANNVVLQDALPTGFVPGSVQATDLTPARGNFVATADGWNLTYNALAPGENGTVTFTVDYPRARLEAGLTNTVTIAADEDAYTGGQTPNDNVQDDTDNWDNDDVILTPDQADVRIDKKQVSAQVNGDEVKVTWLITTRNFGPASATSVTVEDTLPPGAKANSVKVQNVRPASSSTTVTDENVTVNVGTLAVDASASFRLQAVYPLASVNDELVNTVTVDADQDPYTNGEAPNNTVEQDTDNFDSVPVQLKPADLRIVKEAITAEAVPGESFTWTVRVKNVGQGPARNVQVTDLFPAQVNNGKFVKVSQGNFDGPAWNVGVLQAGATATATVTATVAEDATGTMVNRVITSSPDDPSGDPGDPGTCQDNDSFDSDRDNCAIEPVTITDNGDPDNPGNPGDGNDGNDNGGAGEDNNGDDNGSLPNLGGPAFWLLLLGAGALTGGFIARKKSKKGVTAP